MKLSLPSGTVQILLGNRLLDGSDLYDGNYQYLYWYTVFQSPVVTITPPGTGNPPTCMPVAEMSGCQISGSATASSSENALQTPNLAIDGNITTYWNAGATSGTITVTFASGVSMKGLYVNTVASPASSESYTVSVLHNGQWVSEGTTTESIGVSQAQYFIPLPAGTYDGVRLAVGSSSNWVQIYEITTAPSS